MKIESYKTSGHPLFKNKLIFKRQDRGLWRVEDGGVYLLFSSRQINIWSSKGWLIEYAPYREKIKRDKLLVNVKSFEVIKREVSKEFDVYIMDLLSLKSKHKITEARRVLFYICKEKTTLTAKQISKLVGDRSVNTFNKGIQEVKRQISVDRPFQKRINKVINAIRE